MNRYYAPSVADTMSVFSGKSVRGSIYGDEPRAFAPVQKKPPLPVPKQPQLGVLAPQSRRDQQQAQNPYAAFGRPLPVRSEQKRPMSAYGGSARSLPKKQNFIKATGEFEQVPGIGPFNVGGAAKAFVRPLYRGRKPAPTGVFDAKTHFPPTIFSELYHQGALPCKVEFKGKEHENPKGHGTNTAIHWLAKDFKKIDLDRFLPIFVTGLQEKTDPQMFLAYQGLQDLIAGLPVKTLMKQTRGLLLPVKDNLRTLDDEVCVRTLTIILQMCKRSDKVTENFVQHFHMLLPSIEVLRNKHAKFADSSAYQPRKSLKGSSSQSQTSFNPSFKLDETGKHVPIKLAHYKRNTCNVKVGELVQEVLEYFERHGGLYAYVTIKKMIPKYDSVVFA